MLTTSVKKATVLSTSRVFAATLFTPSGIVADGSGNFYVTLPSANSILKITYPGGTVTTFAGSGSGGSTNGTGTGASFSNPGPLSIDSSSNIYVGDAGNNTVRKITTGQVVTTIPFSVPGIRSLAVSPNGSNMVAVDSSSNVRYYVAGTDIGRPAPPPSASTSVGVRSDGSFYRTPSTGASLYRVSAATSTSNETSSGSASAVALTTINGGTFLSNVIIQMSGINNFTTGMVVTLSGFDPADLNVTATLGAQTNTGQIQFQYTFSRTQNSNYTSSGNVAYTSTVETTTAVTVDGVGAGAFSTGISFFSPTQAVLSRVGTGPTIYTFTGDAAVSNGTTSGLSSISNVVVKNATIPELLYTSNVSNIFLYAKQY